MESTSALSIVAGESKTLLAKDFRISRETVSIPSQHAGFGGRCSRVSPSVGADGSPLRFHGVDIYTLRNDRVCALRSLFYPIEVAEQIGIGPPRDIVHRANRETTRPGHLIAH